MGKTLLIFTGLAILASQALAGDVLLPRRFPSCGYVGGQVYCYGGDLDSQKFSADKELYSLDIAKFSGQTTDSLNSKWETVKPITPFDAENRRIPSAIVLPDGKRFLIQGGWTSGRSVNQTIVYDTTKNSWEVALPYSEADRGSRQMYHSTAVNLPNNLVGFYGGYERLADTSIPHVSSSGVTVPYLSSNDSIIGFSNIQMYAPGATSWAPFSPQINPPADYYPNSQTATLDPTSGKVYYLGGSYYAPPVFNVNRIAFQWAYTFNTKSGSWVNETLGGTAPLDRIYHTANLLPNSRHIILYGGTNDGNIANTDYCYTLSLEDNTWTKQENVNVPSYLSGPRFSHASVIVNNTLLILFGRDISGILSKTLLTIDVANVANISYTAIYNAAPGAVESPNNSTNNSTNPEPEYLPPSSGISNGAIGGIVAGVVVVVLLIAAFFVKRFRDKKKAAIISSGPGNEQGNNEQISVDWDKIDEQYREVPPVNTSASNSPQVAHSVDTASAGNLSPGAASTLRSQYTPNLASSTVMEDSTLSFEQRKGQSPNAVDFGVVKPSAETTDLGYTIVKPDAN